MRHVSEEQMSEIYLRNVLRGRNSNSIFNLKGTVEIQSVKYT